MCELLGAMNIADFTWLPFIAVNDNYSNRAARTTISITFTWKLLMAVHPKNQADKLQIWLC